MLARPSNAPFVCARCLSRQQRRLYTTETPSQPTPPPPAPAPPASGSAKLTTRRLISLHGVDAPKFLQGIITNNVRPESTTGLYAAFLTAQGKVLHDTFIYPTIGSSWHREQDGGRAGGIEQEPGYLVEVDADQADVLVRHLKRHKLRSKFKLRLLEPGELEVWSMWKEGDRWTAHGQPQSSYSGSGSNDGSISLTDCRAPGMGQRMILAPGSRDAALQDVDEVPLSAYTIRRYLRGVPEGQTELPRDECLPMNSNIDIMGGIDFKKGCYLGQELTIRTHHTGVVRRRILPVVLYEPGTEPPDALAYQPQSVDLSKVQGAEMRRDDKRKRGTGKFLAGIGNIGLGLCKLEQMTDLTISGEPSPFTSEDRFLLQSEDGEQFALKAFVPDWVRGNIREPKIQKRVE